MFDLLLSIAEKKLFSKLQTYVDILFNSNLKCLRERILCESDYKQASHNNQAKLGEIAVLIQVCKIWKRQGWNFDSNSKLNWDGKFDWPVDGGCLHHNCQGQPRLFLSPTLSYNPTTTPTNHPANQQFNHQTNQSANQPHKTIQPPHHTNMTNQLTNGTIPTNCPKSQKSSHSTDFKYVQFPFAIQLPINHMITFKFLRNFTILDISTGEFSVERSGLGRLASNFGSSQFWIRVLHFPNSLFGHSGFFDSPQTLNENGTSGQWTVDSGRCLIKCFNNGWYKKSQFPISSPLHNCHMIAKQRAWRDDWALRFCWSLWGSWCRFNSVQSSQCTRVFKFDEKKKRERSVDITGLDYQFSPWCSKVMFTLNNCNGDGKSALLGFRTWTLVSNPDYSV